MYVLPARRLAITPRGLLGTFSSLRWRMYSSSSSKPSSPSDRPRNLATPSSSSTKRKAGISSVGGETLAGGQGGFSKLPAVPNTDHLHPAEVAASSFFALHRPLSIKHSIPQVHSTTAFNSIFDPIVAMNEHAVRFLANERSVKIVKSAPASTSTSSSPSSPTPSQFTFQQPQQRPRVVERTMLGTLESLVSSIRDNWSTGSLSQLTFPTPFNRAGQPQSREFSDDDLSLRFFSVINTHLPFHPPPPPLPITTGPSDADPTRPHRQLITIHQTTYPNGMMFFTARSKVLEPITSPYMQRVKERQRENMEQWQQTEMEDPRDGVGRGEKFNDRDVSGEGMMAISVKRQRKLKMKKHKYKKLRDKTRNARRRLEKK